METQLHRRLQLYRMMCLIRRTEEFLMAEYHPADEMRCPMHFCVGQEATPAALSVIMRRSDVLMSHYRSHGYYLAKGASLDRMVAEFYGKLTGANYGIAGSMELGDHDYNFSSGAIVGGSLYIPLGSAFAQRYRELDEISISVIGDGVFDEGVAYEVFNLAALYRLPLLIICENNKYAAHTAIELRQAFPHLSERVKAFGLPTETVDGNNCELLLQALDRIVPDIRSGAGPYFLEVETYRQCGHVGPGSDEEMSYRRAEEVRQWLARDPVLLLRKQIEGAITQAELNQIESDINATVSAAVAKAKRADFAQFEDIISYNLSGEYAAIVEHFVGREKSDFQGDQAEARPGPF